MAALLPIIVQGFWVGLVAQAFAYGDHLPVLHPRNGRGRHDLALPDHLRRGRCLTASQLATNHGWPILAAIVVGGLVALPMGLIIGFLTIRLGDLYVALVTLTFGLLMENLVFTAGSSPIWGWG